jgi:hypothetical protein
MEDPANGEDGIGTSNIRRSSFYTSLSHHHHSLCALLRRSTVIGDNGKCSSPHDKALVPLSIIGLSVDVWDHIWNQRSNSSVSLGARVRGTFCERDCYCISYSMMQVVCPSRRG